MKLKALTEAEEAIMLKVWELATPITSAMLLEAFAETRGWKSQTINTFLSRLVDKKYLSVRKRGVANEYLATVSKEDFEQSFAREVVNKIYGGSVKRLLASFVESESISPEEIEELKRWFAER